MKRVIIILILTLLAKFCPAQNFQEWFRQNVTQQRYLIEQIAQLKVYLELAEKGYEIARDGLNLISVLKDGEFRLHKNRFDSLSVVKPAVKNATMAGDIVGLVRGTIVLYWGLDDILGREEHLSQQEKRYIKGVFDRLAWETEDLLKQREAVLEDGVLSMTDDGRVRIIEKLYLKASENYQFARQVLETSGVLAAQRKRELDQTTNSRIVYGINQ